MIVIEKIAFEDQNSKGIVEVRLLLNKVSKKLRYETNFKLDKLVDSDVWNAAIIGLLPLSFENQWDIRVSGTADDTLVNVLVNELFPVMKQAYHTDFVPKIECELSPFDLVGDNDVAATGLSCGVDSFATIETHKRELGFVTFFDAGSHGKNFQGHTATIRNHRYRNVVNAANELELSLYTIKSNLSDFTNSKFQDNHAFLQLSCAHLLSGMCGKYYYSSGQHKDYLKKHDLDLIYLNNFMVHTLSSNRFKINASLVEWSRIQRTKIIEESKIARNHLDVCVDPMAALKIGIINCSKCDKCMRTQLTLKLLDNYHLFEPVFNSSRYSKNEKTFLATLKISKKKNVLNRELYELAQSHGMYDRQVLKAYYYQLWLKLKKWIKKFLKS